MNPQSKLLKSKEGAQLQWGIELFFKFLMFATRKGVLPRAQSSDLQVKLKQLVKTALSEEEISKQFNRHIEEINTLIKQNADPSKYAPFPSFSIARDPHQQSAILDQLDMVERTISEAAESGVIDWGVEGECFSGILQVFSQVESGKMRPHEGMAKLISEIKEINKSLPSDCTLPLPVIGAYY